MKFVSKAAVCSKAALIGCLLLLTGSSVASTSNSERSSFETAWQSSSRLSPEDEARLAEYENCARKAEQKGDRAGQARAINSIGLVRYKAEEFDEAIEAFARSIALFHSLKDERGEATALAELAGVYIRKGAVREGLTAYQQSLPLWQKLDIAQEAAIMGRMAEVFRQLGDRASALRFNEQALLAFQQAGDKTGEATVLNNVGLSYFTTRNKKKGIEFFNRAWTAYQRAGNELGAAAALNNLAVGYSLSGDQLKSLDAFEKALAIKREHGTYMEVGALLEDIGAVYRKMGQIEKARSYCDSALLLYTFMGNHEAENKTLAVLSSMDKKRGGKWKLKDQPKMELAQSPITQ